jgi:cell division protein FtsL
MQKHLLAFVRPLLRVLIPSLLFFATGAGAVYRQGRGMEMERQLLALAEERQLLEAMEAELALELVHLGSRGRIARVARERLELAQPSGRQIVILQVLNTAPQDSVAGSQSRAR